MMNDRIYEITRYASERLHYNDGKKPAIPPITINDSEYREVIKMYAYMTAMKQVELEDAEEAKASQIEIADIEDNLNRYKKIMDVFDELHEAYYKQLMQKIA